MGKVIAIFNQKGGVGKTTTTVNLAAALSFRNKSVLVCDIDPQANASSGLGLEVDSLNQSIYHVLMGLKTPDQVVLTTGYVNFDLLPSSVDLAGSEIELTSLDDRESRLKETVKSLKDKYDFILVDCPPSLSLLTINALTASDTVLIPIQCEYYAMEGVSQLLNTIELVKKSLNPNLTIEGILLTMTDSRTNLSAQVAAEVKSYFKDLVYDTTVPRNVRLAEAPSFGKTIFDYAVKSKGSIAYNSLADEFLKKQ